MPRRLITTDRDTLEWGEVELPAPWPGQVRVRNRFGAEKHGTMTAFYKGYAQDRGAWDPDLLVHHPDQRAGWNYPIPLGNMNVGETEDGRTVFYHGPFQEEAVVAEAELWELPDGVDWRAAVLLDPGEFALGALRDGGMRIGDDVAVFGLGAIGLMTVQMARLAGAGRILAVDPVAERRERSGADHALDARDPDVGLRLKERTDGRGPDVVVDFSGSPAALQAALRGVAYGGTVVLGAFPPPWQTSLDLGAEAHMNRPRVVFTRACSDPNPDHPRWSHRRIQETVYRFIAQGRIDGSIVDDPVPYAELMEEYPRVAEASGSSIKLSVAYPG